MCEDFFLVTFYENKIELSIARQMATLNNTVISKKSALTVLGIFFLRVLC